LRELLWMREARQKVEETKLQVDWSRTSNLLALLVNMFRDPKKGTTVKPKDFNPYMQKKIKITFDTFRQICQNLINNQES